MTKKRFKEIISIETIVDNKTGLHYKPVMFTDDFLDLINEIAEENEKLKVQLYCDDEEGVCNICKHHYLVKDDETEFGYYNSRCKKGHYECARVSLKYCDDFELKGDFE